MKPAILDVDLLALIHRYLGAGCDRDATTSDEYEVDEPYYLEELVFLVEGCLFKVPRAMWSAQSPVFRDVFTLPPPKGPVDGSGRESPLRLDGVRKDDFRQFLRVLVPIRFNDFDSLTTTEWTSVLALATMWDFEAVRAFAIDRLSASDLNPVDKIVLAKRHYIDEWLIPALNQLAQRHQPLVVDDVDKLGLETALNVVRVRETFPGCGYCGSSADIGYLPSIPGVHADTDYPHSIHGVDVVRNSRSAHDFSAAVREVFSL